MKTITLISLMLIVSVSVIAQSKSDTSTAILYNCSACGILTSSKLTSTVSLSNVVTISSTSTLFTVYPIDNYADYRKGAIISVRKSQTEWLNDSTLVIHPVIK